MSSAPPSLSELEQRRLVRAIESAIDVHQREEFHAWMDGPFGELLAHDILVCLEIGHHSTIRQVEFLHHGLIEAEIIDFLCHPAHGLAPRLIRLFRAKSHMSHVVDPGLFASLLSTSAGGRPPDSLPLLNAVVHRTRFLSGATYFFILFNVPAGEVERSAHLFKLLSSHLKLVLSRVVNTQEMNSHVALTEREVEILRWLGQNKSTREIGCALAISPITVKSHINKIFRKLDVQNRADAVARGLAILDGPRDEP